MTKAAPARRAALAALSDARRREGRIRDIIRTHGAFAALSPADAALATRLAVGAVAARSLLDEVLLAHIRRASSVEPRVMDALRIATFELLYLDTPREVAVSQGVELARSASPRAAGLANAVLRRVAEQGLAGIDGLRAVSALPSWLLDRIAADRGRDAARELARCNLEPAPVYACCDDAAALAPFDPRPTDLDGAWELRAPAGLYGSGLVQAGAVVPSDLSAQRICALVACLAGADGLLEIGQGGGTKTLIIARRCQAPITAIDVLGSKVCAARSRLARAGLSSRATGLSFDGTRLAGPDLPSELDRSFGTVFLDAPCSGTGTMRRHPEIAASLAPERISQLAQLQRALLAAASARVAPGGHLVYSTCSVLAEENEQVVDAFLASDAGASFSRVRGELPFEARIPECDAGASFSRVGPGFQSIPSSGSPDGHFCAVLRKANYTL